MSIEIERRDDGRITITASAEGREVLNLDRDEYGWSIGMSANLPSDVEDARKHIEAFQEAFSTMDKLIAEELTTSNIRKS